MLNPTLNPEAPDLALTGNAVRIDDAVVIGNRGEIAVCDEAGDGAIDVRT
jgi:hypothetical protein